MGGSGETVQAGRNVATCKGFYGGSELRRIHVNKPENCWQLKILFPCIKLAVDGVPLYGKIVYTTFPYVFSEKTELALVQSLQGYNLDSHLGLLGFLRECAYMSTAKLIRFEAMGRQREVDSKGHEVVSEGIFSKDPDVLKMYRYCSDLRISNHSFLEDEENAGYILDILEAPLYYRIREADKVGPGLLLEKVLRFMDSFYSKDIQFKARGHGRVSGFDRMQRVINLFNWKGFMDFKLSGNDIEDIYTFFCLFGEVA
jgi:hypothetical protein